MTLKNSAVSLKKFSHSSSTGLFSQALLFNRNFNKNIILKNVTAAGLHKIILERSEKGSTFKQLKIVFTALTLTIYQIKNVK